MKYKRYMVSYREAGLLNVMTLDEASIRQSAEEAGDTILSLRECHTINMKKEK